MITRRSVGATVDQEQVFIDTFAADKTIAVNVNGCNIQFPVMKSLEDAIQALKEAAAAL